MRIEEKILTHCIIYVTITVRPFTSNVFLPAIEQGPHISVEISQGIHLRVTETSEASMLHFL